MPQAPAMYLRCCCLRLNFSACMRALPLPSKRRKGARASAGVAEGRRAWKEENQSGRIAAFQRIDGSIVEICRGDLSGDDVCR